MGNGGEKIVEKMARVYVWLEGVILGGRIVFSPGILFVNRNFSPQMRDKMDLR